MAAMTLEFALNSGKVTNSWTSGRRRVGNRNVCSNFGIERVAFGCIGNKDDGWSRIRLVCLASADPPGSSAKPPKTSRKSRRRAEGPSESDLKLVGDLKEFISAFGLPPTEVPTTKELIRNGRQDLANAVRRRGYKAVAGLLGFSPAAEAGENNSIDIAADSTARDVSDVGAAGNSSADVQQMSNTGEEETDVLAISPGGGGSRSSSPVISIKKIAKSNGFASYAESTFRESSISAQALVSEVLILDTQKEHVGRASPNEWGDQIQRQFNIKKGASQNSELLQKFGTVSEGGENSFEDEEESGSDYSDDEYEDNDENYEDEELDSSIEVPLAQTDSDVESAEAIAAKKAALLRSRILEYFDSRKDDRVKPDTVEDGRLPRQVALEQENNSVEVQAENMDLENNQKIEADKELERIKDLLRDRELVLTEVTKELEEAKAQFSLARAKATAELVHATQLASEREARLQAAEGALSSLRQVHLEWWGEAKHVELAGTFNGWQHRILMEPDPTSEIPKPDGSRGPMMWGTHLYLYPGVYEIKFIVDGNWQLDHRREVVMRHGNQNNVLRVEL